MSSEEEEEEEEEEEDAAADDDEQSLWVESINLDLHSNTHLLKHFLMKMWT